MNVYLGQMTDRFCASGDVFWQQCEKVNQAGQCLLGQFPPHGLVLLLPVKFETGGELLPSLASSLVSPGEKDVSVNHP